jgi:hypothetical protein
VADGHHLAGTEEELADGQRPDLIAGDNTARVADDVSLAIANAENAVDVQPGVHAGDDCDVPGRQQRQQAGERRGITFAGTSSSSATDMALSLSARATAASVGGPAPLAV